MRKLAGFALGFLVGDYLAGLIIHRAEQRLALLTLRACHRLLDGVEALAVGQPDPTADIDIELFARQVTDWANEDARGQA